MRRKLLVFGVVLVCIGIPLVYFGNASHEVTELLGSRQSDSPNQSSITYEYLKGQKLLVRIAPGRDWSMFADISDEFKQGGQYINLVSVNVTIIDPNRHLTKLEAEYGIVPNTQGLALYVVKVNQKSNGMTLKTFNRTWVSGSNNYTSEYLFESEIGGIAEVDGTYNATVSLWGAPIPPSRVTLDKYSVTAVQDYPYLLPLGVAVLAVGSLIAILAGLATSRRIHARPTRQGANRTQAFGPNHY